MLRFSLQPRLVSLHLSQTRQFTLKSSRKEIIVFFLAFVVMGFDRAQPNFRLSSSSFAIRLPLHGDTGKFSHSVRTPKWPLLFTAEHVTVREEFQYDGNRKYGGQAIDLKIKSE